MSFNPNALAWLAGRRSNGRMTDEPVPAGVLAQALQAALWAPDHRRLQPWRFQVIQGEARAQLANVLEAAQRAQDPDVSASQLGKIRLQPWRAPVLVVAILQPVAHDKVPHVEQVLSMGAAIENFLLMIEAQGYHAMWRTGLLVDTPVVREAFGLTGAAQICGIIYVGRAASPLPAHEPVALEAFVEAWHGPVAGPLRKEPT